MADTVANPSSSAHDPFLALEGALAPCGSTLLRGGADGIPVTVVARERWLDLARRLKDDPELAYEMLVDVTAVDWLERDPRFDVVYHLWSLTHNRMLRVKVPVSDDDPSCPSVVGLWGTANWLERETFDLMGIRFPGHPDLRRILMPEDYPWHPLRKDFPHEGIDNSYSYVRSGGVLMTSNLRVDLPAGQDRTPIDRSKGDPPGYTDGTAEVNT